MERSFTGMLPGMPDGIELGVVEGRVAVQQLARVITSHMGLSSDTGLRNYLKANHLAAITRVMPGDPIFMGLVKLGAIRSRAPMADTIPLSTLSAIMQVRQGCPEAMIMKAVENAVLQQMPAPQTPSQIANHLMNAMRPAISVPPPPPQQPAQPKTAALVPPEDTWPYELPEKSGVPKEVIGEARYSEIEYRGMWLYPRKIKGFSEVLDDYCRFNSHSTVAARDRAGASKPYLDVDVKSISSCVGFLISHVLRPRGIEPPPPHHFLRLYLNPHYFTRFVKFLLERDTGVANFANHFRAADKAIEWLMLFDKELRHDMDQRELAQQLREHYAKLHAAVSNHLSSTGTTIYREDGGQKLPKAHATTMSREEVKARAEATIYRAAQLVAAAHLVAEMAANGDIQKSAAAARPIQTALLAAFCCGGYMPVQRPGDMLGLTCAGYIGPCLKGTSCRHGPRCMGNTLYRLPVGKDGEKEPRYAIALSHHKRGLWRKKAGEQVIIELPHELNPLVDAMHTWGDEALRREHGTTVDGCPQMFTLQTKATPISPSYFAPFYKRTTGMTVGPREARQVILTAEVELGVLDRDVTEQLAWEAAEASNTSARQVLQRYDLLAFVDKARVMCGRLRGWREDVVERYDAEQHPQQQPLTKDQLIQQLMQLPQPEQELEAEEVWADSDGSESSYEDDGETEMESEYESEPSTSGGCESEGGDGDDEAESMIEG